MVLHAFKNRYQTHFSGSILYLPEPCSHWPSFIPKREGEYDHLYDIRFVVYKVKDGEFRVQGVPKLIKAGKTSQNAFPELKEYIPQDAQGATFVHP